MSIKKRNSGGVGGGFVLKGGGGVASSSGGGERGGGGGGFAGGLAHSFQPVGLPPTAPQIPQPQIKVSLRDFSLLKVVGKGSFGKVMQVRKKDTGRIYAMKVLHKSNIVKRNQVEHTRTERNVLSRLGHPFIVGLNFAFQTTDKLYFVLDYCGGGELFFHLGKEGRFTEDRSRFYCAQITLALEHLHSMNVIYRDLKPENVLLDAKGNVRLTDFGLSKEGVNAVDSGAHSFCGTPEYLAPEVLNRTGHGRAVDWWSLGALLYEMLTGLPPFCALGVGWHIFTLVISPPPAPRLFSYRCTLPSLSLSTPSQTTDCRDRTQLFEKIRKGTLEFPPYLSGEAQDLLTQLLERDPQKRLGCGPGDAADVKRQPFFKCVDWDALFYCRLPPPFVPQIMSSIDTSQFDAEFTSMPIISPNSQKEAPLGMSVTGKFEGFSFVAHHVIPPQFAPVQAPAQAPAQHHQHLPPPHPHPQPQGGGGGGDMN